MRLKILLAITCTAIGGGCITAGHTPFLIVANACSYTVTNVTVESEEAVLYAASSIDPHSAARKTRIEPNSPKTVRMRWTRQGGDMVTRTVQLDPPSPQTFRGRIYIQIETNSEVRVFFLENTEPDEGVLPWTPREPWEGSPSIPGFNQE